MDIEIAKEKLKIIDIKFFLNGMIGQSNYIIDKADEINIAIETVLSELEKKDKIIDLIVEDFQNDGYLKGMSREEILDYYQERLWLKKQRNPLPLKLDIVG